MKTASVRMAAVLGIVGVLIGSGVAVRSLVWAEWDPTVFVKVGEQRSDGVAYMTNLLGEVEIAPQAGHDGYFFFVQAMDPFYLAPEKHAVLLDRPAYRAQRMLYPSLAGGFGAFPPEAIAWALVLVNVVAFGVGTFLAASLCQQLGISPWFGLAFPLNVGLLVELNIDGAGVLAMVGLMGAVLATERREHHATAGWLAVAVLSRETMMIAAAGLAVWWWLRLDRRRAIEIALVPALLVTAWWIYLHLRLPWESIQDTQAIGLPFTGLVRAIPEWLSQPNGILDILVGVLIIVAGLRVAVATFRLPSPLSWATAGFLILAVVMSEPVWRRYFDAARAVAPIITSYVLVAAASLRVGSAPDEARWTSDRTFRGSRQPPAQGPRPRGRR